jgi:diguanylate cyclase (GGDEF)-like protein/PAS domain S-box-containing protein
MPLQECPSAADIAPVASEMTVPELQALHLAQLREYAAVVLDPDGNVRGWNIGAELITGYGDAEITGSHFGRLYRPESIRIGHPERELMAAASGGSYRTAGWRVRRDGTLFWAEFVITALLAGANDPVGFGLVIRDLTAQKQAEEESANAIALLDATAHTDHLTGLPNRRALDLALERELTRARTAGTPLSIAMIDLDNFKVFNDRLGHKHADLYLRQTASAWRTVVRTDDLLARYGGEEFTLVLPNCEAPDALQIAERLRLATPTPVTCSTGIATWDGREDVSQLLTRADRTLFHAKRRGRNLTLLATTPSAEQLDTGFPAGPELGAGLAASFVDQPLAAKSA